MATALIWVVVSSLVLGVVLMQNLGGTGAATQAQATIPDEPGASSALIEVMGKYAVFAVNAAPVPADQRKKLIGQLEGFDGGTYNEIRVAILVGEVIGPDEAIDRLARIRESIQGEQATPSTLLDDLDTLDRVYAGHSVTPDAATRLADRYGWFGRLAISFGQKPDDPTRSGVVGAARRVGFVLIGAFAVIGLAGLLGFALLITAIVLLALGRFRLRYRRPDAVTSLGVETLGVFLVSFLIVSVIVDLLRPVLGIQALWITWILALTPLWPVVRGMDWARFRQRIGWRRGQGVFVEIGAGIMGYVAGLPIVFLGVLMTLALMAIWGWITGAAQGAPTHPLPDELINGGIGGTITLFIVATVWAPLVEESIFRGLLYDHLRGFAPAIVSALIVGLIFASLHPQGLLAVPALMSIGVVLSLIREWRGSLIASMTGHALNNGFVVTMLLLAFSA